jgi:hypothetical protein
LPVPGDGFDDDPVERGEYLATVRADCPIRWAMVFTTSGLVHWPSPSSDGRTRRITVALVPESGRSPRPHALPAPWASATIVIPAGIETRTQPDGADPADAACVRAMRHRSTGVASIRFACDQSRRSAPVRRGNPRAPSSRADVPASNRLMSSPITSVSGVERSSSRVAFDDNPTEAERVSPQRCAAPPVTRPWF